MNQIIGRQLDADGFQLVKNGARPRNAAGAGNQRAWVRTKRFDWKENRKVDTPFYTVTFPAGTRMTQLDQVKAIGHVIGSFQPVRMSKRGSVQCHKCQCHGHMSADCFRRAMCVKCGGQHLSRDCTVITCECPREKLYCGQCKQPGHPANWSALRH